MISLPPLLQKAENSTFALWKLNLLLWRMIPFNAPHRFKVVEVTPESLTIEMPYIQKNLNHIKGLHACGLAALCEYVCGLHLIKLANTNQYRILLKSLKLDYHYQGKKAVKAQFTLNQTWFHENIEIPLKTEPSILHSFHIEVFDGDQKLICTGIPEWQIKAWNQVKTKV